ncbi:MAG: HEAT repeat domain-containing protein [Sedimentisphaerales bacterium]|nr:HEAT repeat domain-containing protein [Sedimentisphaerales bacterium]
MNVKFSYTDAMKKQSIILILLILLQSIGFVIAAEAVEPKSEADEQLEINRIALLSGPDEQIRTKAASLILHSENPAARPILLGVLGQSGITPARTAVCKAIAESNGNRVIRDKELFIQPLVNVLTSDNPETAKLAAKALLVFDYDQIEGPLLEKINDESLSVEARLNAVYAVRIQPDIDAIVRLIELLGNPNEQISASAGEALTSLGIPAVGADSATQKQIIADLKRIGKEEFIRIWQMRQEYENKLERLRKEREIWKSKSLGLLDEVYGRLGADESAKIAFLSKYLSGTEPEERMWAVNKVSQWWKGTDPKSKLLAELGPDLMKLISDNNRDVRFNTAKLFSYMGELNSCDVLLKQIKVEEDADVRLEQFAALGQSCRFAFSPQSPFKLANEVRKQTLDLAIEYLRSENALKTQKGAEVLRNNLEHNGFSETEIENYLQALSDRYKQDSTNSELAGELLNSMAMLCSRGVYRQQAIEKYERMFVAALSDENALVREAAVKGLINISKSQALAKLRRDFTNDSSANIRKAIIGLAEEVGTAEDLAWLFDKTGNDPDGAAAWKAMLGIFEQVDVEMMSQWTAKIEASELEATKRISFFEIFERKSEGNNNKELLKKARLELAGLYRQINELNQASKYLAELIKDETHEAEKEKLKGELLQLYLTNDQIDSAKSLIENQLMEKDFGAECPMGQVLLGFIKSDTPQLQTLIDALRKIQQPGQRPKWQKFVKSFTQLEDKATKPDDTASETKD